MPDNEKTFNVECPYCHLPFMIRRRLENTDATGDGQEMLECQYCGELIAVTLPQAYLPVEIILKGKP